MQLQANIIYKKCWMEKIPVKLFKQEGLLSYFDWEILL